MHSDGWLSLLVSAGLQVRHRLADGGWAAEQGYVIVDVLRDGKVVLTLEQDEGGRGATSMAEVYRRACFRLGLVKDKHEVPPPLDLTITEENSDTPHAATVYRHPSFGLAQVARYQGTAHKHFMSPINVSGGFNLRFCAAELRHDKSLGLDRVHAGEVLFECYMSTVQFAEMITSAGVGEGVPVTIHFANGIGIQPCEVPSAVERTERLAAESMDTATADLTALADEIEAEMSGAGALSAGRKREIWEKLRRLLHEVDGKPAWLMRIFREHMNTALTHAKGEFAHWADRYSAKQAAIQGGSEAPALPAPPEGK